MITYKTKLIFLLLCLFPLTTTAAKELISEQCEPLIEKEYSAAYIPYTEGLLWKLSKDGQKESYLFGTIHISDTEVTTLPLAIEQALYESEQFVMETIPDLEQIMFLSQAMNFTNEQRLSEFIDAPIYSKTVEILSSYQLDAAAVSIMKPWSAFLTMSYPPNLSQGELLDVVLLLLAQENGATTLGLETLQEQIAIFNQLNFDEQAKLLTDTVCHYDVVKENFAIAKVLYLKRDLLSLYNHALRHTMMERQPYKKIIKKLIIDRNIKMVERMQPMLKKDKTFIAIGALHLPGKQGVLALLKKQGYRVTAIF